MLDLISNEIYSENIIVLPLVVNNQHELFEIIYHKYKCPIYDVAIKYLKSDSLAEEVVQVSFNRFKLFYLRDENEASIELWLFTEVKKNVLFKLKELAKR